MTTRISALKKWLDSRSQVADIISILILTLLWAFYFWRVLTPNPNDQVSLPQGDFSGQFLAFGSYQASRLLNGQIPLWNPYNYAGLPFIADTQAAVFYPPRLLTIVISHFWGGWSYNALQIEVIAHYWLASVMMFWFMKMVTTSRTSGIVSAIVFAYGGYLTGYPALQVAVLETATWFPLTLLGVFIGTQQPDSALRPRWHVKGIAIASLALGLSLLAGHPQTALYITYTVVAYAVYRFVSGKLPVIESFIAIAATVVLGYGVAALQLIPSAEYLSLTTRTDLGFNARAGGFPFSDLITFIIPGVFTTWSPLYSGVGTLAISLFALMSPRKTGRNFWFLVTACALALSFGQSLVFYPSTYLLVPGFSLFRGQERAAFVIAGSVAVLAGLGMAQVLKQHTSYKNWSKVLTTVTIVAWSLALLTLWLRVMVPAAADLASLVQAAFFLSIILTLTWLLFRFGMGRLWLGSAMIALVVIDLFSVTMRTNWEPVPSSKRVLLSDLVPVVASDSSLFRVDGRIGLSENYGTLAGIQDIRGTSPLKLTTLQNIMTLPENRAFELLSVKYVFTDWQQLSLPTDVVAETDIKSVRAYLHQVDNPLPRAWMVYKVMNTLDTSQALGWLADPSYDVRGTVVMKIQPALSLPQQAPEAWTVEIIDYQPESIQLRVSTPDNGMLVLSELYYPGWVAYINGSRADIQSVNVGLRGLELPSGDYDVAFRYEPDSFRIGVIISLLAVMLIIVLFLLR